MAINVIFALTDPVTQLICKLGQGHHGYPSPTPEYYGTRFGLYQPCDRCKHAGHLEMHEDHYDLILGHTDLQGQGHV